MSLQSIRGRIALLLALAFLPAGGIALQSGLTSVAVREAALQESVGAAELQDMAGAREEVTQLREVARTLAANAYLFAGDLRVCRHTLLGFVEEFPSLAVVSVLDAEAVVQCSNIPEAVGTTAASRSLIEEAARTDRVAVGFIAAPRFSRQPVLAAVARAQVSDSRPGLFVGVSRHSRPLTLPDERALYAAIADGEGRILDISGLALESAEGQRLAGALAGADLSDMATARRVDDTWIVVMQLEEERLYLVRGWTPAPPTLGQRLQTWWALLSPILLWVAAVAAAWYAVELFVARPLLVVERLARAYARGADGGDEENLLRGAPAEISSLRRTMQAMAKTLRGREARLAEALQEERALLHEVNHRVKNNLQMVASLLSIQSRAAEDKGEARALAHAQARVQLLALAHSRIYASGAVREVALDQLAAEIGRTILAARGAASADVKLNMEFDATRASADRALALAFLMGEALGELLDCLTGQGPSVVDMRLKAYDDGRVVFEVSSGQAVRGETSQPAFERIIEAFARQLDATIERNFDGACSMRIIIPPAVASVLSERSAARSEQEA